MFWLYLAAWVWLLGALLVFAVLWLGFEALWTDAEADETRPSSLPVAVEMLAMAASWPLFPYFAIRYGRPRRRNRR